MKICFKPIDASGLKRLLAVCLLTGSLASHLQLAAQAKPAEKPDVLIFTNGDQLTGKFEKGEGDSITFKSDMAGEVTVPLAKVKELRSSGNFALLRKDTKTPTTNVQVGTVTYADGNVVLAEKTGTGTETVPAKNVDFIIDEPTYDKQIKVPGGLKGLRTGWKGGVTGGATIVRSTENGSTFTAAANLTRSIPVVSYLPAKDRSIFVLSETYGKLSQPVIPQTTPPTPPSVAKTDIFQTSFEQDRYFSPRFYALANLNFLHDYSQGLRLEQIYGGGGGWTVIQNAKQEFDVKAQIQYEKQAFEPPTVSQNLIGATISEAYRRSLPRKIVFTESASALPAFNNANAYSATATAGLELPVWKRFDLSFTTTDNFLNDPAVGFKKNSYQFITGVTYTIP